MQSIDQEGKSVEEALERALTVLNKKVEDVDYEVLDEGSKGILGVGARPILVRVRVKELPEMKKIKEFINNLFSELDIVHQPPETDVRNNVITVNIDTDEAGILIGKYGQVLESLQYLVNQIMHESKYKYMVDISNYRDKQNNKLVETARKFAGIVRDEQRRITLKPMSAFERRIIHETIKEFPELTTKSIGVDPERRVVISLLNPPERSDYGRRSSNGNRFGQGGNKPFRKGGNFQRNPNFRQGSSDGARKPYYRNPNSQGDNI